jgi:hypothetical protein
LLFLERADLSSLWSLATCRQQRRDSPRRKRAVTDHRTRKTAAALWSCAKDRLVCNNTTAFPLPFSSHLERTSMKRFVIAISVLVFALSSFAAIAAAQETRHFTVEDLLKVRRVGDPQVSPDGRHVAFTIGDVNYDLNKVITQIYVTSIGGGEMKQLTSGAASSTAPRWSPDGKRIAFITGGQVGRWKAMAITRTR